MGSTLRCWGSASSLGLRVVVGPPHRRWASASLSLGLRVVVGPPCRLSLLGLRVVVGRPCRHSSLGPPNPARCRWTLCHVVWRSATSLGPPPRRTLYAFAGLSLSPLASVPSGGLGFVSMGPGWVYLHRGGSSLVSGFPRPRCVPLVVMGYPTPALCCPRRRGLS